jgi:pSer/pThr/pTyr-binding forkhead associated (FHA) protein
MSLSTNTPQTSLVSPGSRESGIDLAMPRLLLVDGTIIACLRRFNGSRLVIGRDPSSDLCLPDDPHISATHACIEWNEILGAHVLYDCQSSNGTHVDRVRLKRPTRLENGARIRVGLTELVYCSKRSTPGYVSSLTRRVSASHDTASVAQGDSEETGVRDEPGTTSASSERASAMAGVRLASAYRDLAQRALARSRQS